MSSNNSRNGGEENQDSPREQEPTPGAEDVERSPAGDVIYRYELPFSPGFIRAAQSDEEALTLLDEHIARHVAVGAESGYAWHEIMSDFIHIDVIVQPPSSSRNYYTLITSGMSDLPMRVPPAAEDQKYAELMLCLPPDWPLVMQAGQVLPNEEAYWPVRMLKNLGRFPHEYETWFGIGHTIPNGDPPEPLASGVGFCGTLFMPPLLFGDEFRTLKVRDDKTIQFLAAIPLYESEMDCKLKHGLSTLLNRLDAHHVTELLDVQRPNVWPEE